MEDFGIRMLLSECTVANLIHVLCPVVRLSFFRSFALRNKLQRPHLAIGLQEINPLLLGFTSRPRSSSSRPSSRPLQSLSKTSPGWVLTGCNFNEVRTRCKRGPIEVIEFWETDPLSLLTNSLVATRFRILVRTVKFKSFQPWSRRANQAKQQLQARATAQKRKQRANKGDRGERKGHKLGKQGGGNKFERAQTV